jgi:hypothetical protein
MVRQNIFILVYSLQVQLEPICFKYQGCNPFCVNTLCLGKAFSPLSNICELCQCLPVLGGGEVRICGGSYTRRFVYAEVRIQYTNSYTEVVYCRQIDIEETRIQ